MNNTHCYNQECINGTALKICDHDIEHCTRDFYPAMALGTDDCFAYCSKECKAKVVMVDYNPAAKPRSVKEMQYRIQLMKQRLIEQKGVSK